MRYPGSKDKIARMLIAHFPVRYMMPLWQSGDMEYREPFFGGGAVGIRAMEAFSSTTRIWINDADYWLTCYWTAIRDQPKKLIRLIRGYTPSVDDFYRLKEQDGDRDVDPLVAGFQKLVLHQISFSGNGVMAGGPIGGREQRSEYNVDCRWNPQTLTEAVSDQSARMRTFRDFRITCGDFADLIVDAPDHAFIYTDPPYYKAGPQLYKHSFGDAEHARLAESLAACRAQWVLSYDDHPAIRALYPWAQIESVEMTYTTAVSKGPRRKNSELVIKPPAPLAEAAE